MGGATGMRGRYGETGINMLKFNRNVELNVLRHFECKNIDWVTYQSSYI